MVLYIDGRPTAMCDRCYRRDVPMAKAEHTEHGPRHICEDCDDRAHAFALPTNGAAIE